MSQNHFEIPGAYRNTSTGGDIYSRTGGNVGGWPTKEAAMAGIAPDQRLGTVVSVIEAGVPVDYWWKEGVELQHLIPYGGVGVQGPIGPVGPPGPPGQSAPAFVAIEVNEVSAGVPDVRITSQHQYNLWMMAFMASCCQGGTPPPATSYAWTGASTCALADASASSSTWAASSACVLTDNEINL